MADFYTPVHMDRAAFDQLIVRVDKAVGEHAVALVLHEDFPFRRLDLISPDAIDFSNIPADDPDEIVENLDQLLYFAFEGVPRSIITAWAAESENPELAEEALGRISFIQKSMPELRYLWNAKSDAITPPMVSFSYETTVSSGMGRRSANIYIAASRISAGGEPDKTDMTRLRIQLWPSDVRLLIRELRHLWEDHLLDSQDEAEENAGDEDDDEAAEATS